MAKEILSIPEQYLKEVIWVIRAGVRAASDDGHRSMISQEIEGELLEWCEQKEEYLNRD